MEAEAEAEAEAKTSGSVIRTKTLKSKGKTLICRRQCQNSQQVIRKLQKTNRGLR